MKNGLFTPKGLIIDEDMFNILSDEHKKVFKPLPNVEEPILERDRPRRRNPGRRSDLIESFTSSFVTIDTNNSTTFTSLPSNDL